MNLRTHSKDQVDGIRTLVARDDLVASLSQLVIDGISVLLVGPSGVGKSALIEAVTRTADIDVVDPFERISRIQAARLRRRLDGGVTMMAAARTPDRSSLGAVGRILWRFRIVRVRPLSGGEIASVIRLALPQHITVFEGVDHWIHEMARVANGLPGRGRAFADAGERYWRQHGALPTLEWTVVDALTTGLAREEHMPRPTRTGLRYVVKRNL